ncbi:MAG: alkaline metalloproteinase [Halobacteriovoraceae bacterium]|nr:alkaline metalloproteinase [Halobacteriovoraceae bacterium]
MCDICRGTASFDPRRHSDATGGSSPDESLANLPLPTSDVTVPTDPLPTASLDELATYLTSGYWQDTGQDSRSFADVIGNSTNHVITVDLTGLTAEGQRLARWALDAWELSIDVQFTEVQIDGDITFDDEDSGAYVTYDEDSLGRLHADLNISTDWLADYGTTMDSYSYSTYVHEIGHTLGLGHMGFYNGSSGSMTYANDSYQVSVMSYIPQDQNPNVDADYAEAAGPMIADILAVQNIYGISQVTDGDTTWGVGGTYSRQFATLFSTDPDTGPIGFAIYDAGGDNDMIDLRASRGGGGDRLNLNQTSFSDIAGLIGNLAMASGTVIEQARMGRGNDTVIGNDADNLLWGDNGRDRLYGGGGTDSLFGGSGRDRLFGGAMDDRLRGQKGKDYLDSGEGDDVMIGGGGADEFFYGFGHDQDTIRDFTLGQDRLVFTAIDFGTQDAEDLLATYGQTIARGIRLDFGTSATSGGSYNDVLILVGVHDLDALADDIIFV